MNPAAQSLIVPNRYKLTLQYRGTQYKGWQSQPSDGDKTSRKTIQSVVEESLSKIVGHKTNVIIAGRTDAGVHAIRNCAHVDITRAPKRPTDPIPSPFSAQTLKIALNTAMKSDPDILVTQVERVSPEFHARFTAVERTYIYRILSSPRQIGRPFEHNGRWYIRHPLNISRMEEACQILQGHHDFSSFRSSGDPSNPVKTLDQLTVRLESTHPSMDFALWCSPNELENTQIISITARARSFMTHQVRKMVAAIVLAGGGALSLSAVQNILDAKSPSACPSMAPACGLFLSNIVYPTGSYEIFDSSCNSFEELGEYRADVEQNRFRQKARDSSRSQNPREVR